MNRYILSPEAAGDLFDIWDYIESQSRAEIADRVVSEIRARIEFLSGSPSVGHRRKDLSHHDLRFFASYSYLIVYRPNTNPLQIVSILHGRRDVEQILNDRF
jgi:plasmid stabilization system protein ParE